MDQPRPDERLPAAPRPGPVGRRGVIAAAAAAGGVLLTGCEQSAGRGAPARPAATASERAAADVLVVRGVRRLSGDVSYDGARVHGGGTLEFDPDRSTTLTVTGNVVVRGLLRMRPARPEVVHEIRFTGIDESAFVGATMGPVASDVGLWVMGRGVLDLKGTRRQGWNRTGEHPTWRAGDEVLRAPNAVGDYDTYVPHPPGTPLPTVTGPNGVTYATEAFNLTRNVVIAGQPGGRSHVFIRSQGAQSIKHVLFQWMGPRRPATEGNADTEPVTGRYPVHFHMCGNGSRGSVVAGCVVRDSSRAYVPHASHGITMRDCVAFRILNDAFWWDEQEVSNALTWKHCAVFDLRYDPEYRGTIAGFVLGLGTKMEIRDCVAVGSHGNGNDAGFQWPSFANQRPNNVWQASDLVAHNCRGDGVFVWQNDENSHLIQRLTCYRNGDSGLQHGAYRNAYSYEDVVLFDNGVADLIHNALGKDVPGLDQYQQWHRLWAPTMLISDHAVDSDRPVKFFDARIDKVTVDEFKAGGGIYEIHADLSPGLLRRGPEVEDPGDPSGRLDVPRVTGQNPVPVVPRAWS
jgi:hypothetical protein